MYALIHTNFEVNYLENYIFRWIVLIIYITHNYESQCFESISNNTLFSTRFFGNPNIKKKANFDYEMTFKCQRLPGNNIKNRGFIHKKMIDFNADVESHTELG